MISDSNLVSQEQPIFANPEILQQLRDQLLSLLQQDTHHLNSLLSEMHFDLQENELQLGSQTNLTTRLIGYLNEFEEQSHDRSQDITTLGNMAVRMIDYIREEQQRHLQIVDRYQHQAEGMRNTIDFLTIKSDSIENQVEAFREQLQNAQNEIEQMIGERELARSQVSLLGGEQETRIEKDRQIQILEAELERIREQLRFFKFNAHNRPSQGKLTAKHNLVTNKSESYIFMTPQQQKSNRLALEQELNKSIKMIEQLERQNDNLKRDILNFYQLRVRQNKQKNQPGGYKYREIREEPVEETERTMAKTRTIEKIQRILGDEIDENKGLLYKATSFTLLHKNQSKKSLEQQQVTSIKKDQKEEEDILSQSHLQHSIHLADGPKMHALSSEWSSKSFQNHQSNLVYQIMKSSKLQLLNLDQQEYPPMQKSHRIHNYQYNIPIGVQETKQTQSSIKQSEMMAHSFSQAHKSIKYCSVGVNTTEIDRIQHQTLNESVQTKQNSILQTISTIPLFLFSAMTEIIIRRRVKRNSKNATDSMHAAIVC